MIRPGFIGLMVIALITFSACSDSTQIPKPYGYFRIDLPAHKYHEITSFPEFAFPASDLSIIQRLPDSGIGTWFNLIYPEWSAVLYCSYLPITPPDFRKVAEDSYQLVYRHAIKADAIESSMYDNPEINVHAILYEIKGNVASPLQFVVTDSVNHFLRGSLYFNHVPNQDSITPVLQYLREDVEKMLSGFYWK